MNCFEFFFQAVKVSFKLLESREHMSFLYISARIDHRDSGVLGLYAEEGMRFQTSQWTAVTLAKLMWRYGLDIYNAKHWVSNVGFKQFSR